MDSSFALMSFVSGAFFYVLSVIPWTLTFLLTRYVGIYYYHIKEKEACVHIQRKLYNCCSTITDGGKGMGYSCGYWYILYLQASNNGYLGDNSVWIIATKKSYETLIEEEASHELKEFNEVTEIEDSITLLERFGRYDNLYYRKRELTFDSVPRVEQTKILTSIEDLFSMKRYLCVLIHGEHGTGKSMCGLFLTRRLGGVYCDTMNPFGPGDTIHTIYNDTDYDKKRPLIIILDEIDTQLEKVHAGIPSHKSIDILAKDKTGWNRMLDTVQKGLFKNIILILTTNKTPEYIRSIDPSFIRAGRVDGIYELRQLAEDTTKKVEPDSLS